MPAHPTTHCAGWPAIQDEYACHEWTPDEQALVNGGQSNSAVCAASGLYTTNTGSLLGCLSCPCCAVSSEFGKGCPNQRMVWGQGYGNAKGCDSADECTHTCAYGWHPRRTLCSRALPFFMQTCCWEGQRHKSPSSVLQPLTRQLTGTLIHVLRLSLLPSHGGEPHWTGVRGGLQHRCRACGQRQSTHCSDTCSAAVKSIISSFISVTRLRRLLV